MTGKALVRIALWLLLSGAGGLFVWLIAGTQPLINLVLGLLLGLVAGALAFLLVRVVLVIWKETGIDDWIDKRTGGYDEQSIIAAALARIVRNVGLWLVVSVFWPVIATPPAAFVLFYLAFFPGGPYRSNAWLVLTIGIAISYSTYGLCSTIYWDAYRKAADASDPTFVSVPGSVIAAAARIRRSPAFPARLHQIEDIVAGTGCSSVGLVPGDQHADELPTARIDRAVAFDLLEANGRDAATGTPWPGVTPTRCTAPGLPGDCADALNAIGPAGANIRGDRT